MRAPLDDILAMAVFARVVETNSFTAAARALGLSKSVVSTRVAALEDRLGTRLLRRTTRRVVATEAGLKLYPHCARLVGEADEAAATAAGVSASPRGLLRISAPITFAEDYLASPLAEFSARYPEVKLDVSLSDRVVNLIAEHIDVGIRIVSRLRDASLIARKLADDVATLCAAPSYLSRHGMPETPQDLVRHNCLTYTRVSLQEEWRFETHAGPISVPVSGTLQADSGAMLRQAAIAGVGIAVLPRFMVARALAQGCLISLLPDARFPKLGVYAVHAHGRHVPLKIKALLDVLSASFRNTPWKAADADTTV